MAYDELKKVLEELPDPSHCEGTVRLTEPLAIALPDGDVGALGDKMFVEWLLEHSEDAPFGEAGVTKVDKKVRHAQRLRARGKADIAGFDPSTILGEIEAALSPRFHLDAKLEDILVYPKGGKFARHKDTPRTTDLVGTLVVGLPIAHEGGGFEIVDGGKRHFVDWSGKKPDTGAVRWVALFSDLDHAIDPIKSGARVTLVYSLSRSNRPRVDATRDKKLAKLRPLIGALKLGKDPLMIACTRQIVSDGKQPQSIDTLRGIDREIADSFVEAGFDVAVRACMAGDDQEGGNPTFPDTANLWAITRLAKPLPAAIDSESLVSFTDSVDADEYGSEDIDATLLGDHVHDFVMREHWVIRKRAAATVVYEGMYTETGYFGNEGSIGHIYSLAAIEVTKAKGPAKKKAKPKAKAAAKPKAKPKAKKR